MGQENTDWELEEGIPQFEDPFIQQYLKGRNALIAEEQKRRHGKLHPLWNKPQIIDPVMKMPHSENRSHLLPRVPAA